MRSGVGFLLWASERSLRKSKEVSDAARSKKDAHQQMKSESFSDIGCSFPRVAGERTHTKFTLAAYDKPLRYV